MKKKDGFTLIEILAVIIVLGLIGTVIIPKVVSTISNSKKNSYKVSVNNLVQALNTIAVDKKATLTYFDGCNYDFSNGINTCEDLEYSGSLPTSGSINVDADGVVNGMIVYDQYTFVIENGNIQLYENLINTGTE